MIGDNLHKLGLTRCDILESERNKVCEVVIDTHSKRLVALQPDDESGKSKRSATVTFLQENLSKIHRSTLYSRVITTENIKLEDIQKLVMYINDKSEELIDHILEGCQIDLKSQFITSMLLEIQNREVAEFILNLQDTSDIFGLYALTEAIDETQVEQLLPFIKAVTQQCMMLEDGSSYCDLRDRYQECLKILWTCPPWNDQDRISLRSDCTKKLAMLQKMWMKKEIADRWDQIKAFSQVPVAGRQDPQLTTSRKAEVPEVSEVSELVPEVSKAPKVSKAPGLSTVPEAEVSEMQEEQEIHEMIQEIQEIQEIHEMLYALDVLEMSEKTTPAREVENEARIELLKLSQALAEKAPLSDSVEDSTEPSEVKMEGSTCTVTSSPQYQETLVCPDPHQAVYQKDKARAIGRQHEKTSGLLAKAAAVVAPATVSSDTPVLLESQGAIPKKTRLSSIKQAESVSNVAEITDPEAFVKRVLEKCKMAHEDCVRRKIDYGNYFCSFCYSSSAEKMEMEKALEALSRGLCCATYLSVALFNMMADVEEGKDIDNNPVFKRLSHFQNLGAFKDGMLPWFDETRKIPFFQPCNNKEGKRSFVLGDGLLPSEAIKACREQPFFAGFYCFFQILVYETVMETVGEKSFDWYYSRHNSRLRLVDEWRRTPYDSDKTVPPIIPMTVGGSARKDKIGMIKKWGNIAYQKNDCIDKLDILYGICIDENKGHYLVPGSFRIERKKVGSSVILKALLEENTGTSTDDEDIKNTLITPEKPGKPLTEMVYRFNWDGIWRIKTLYSKHLRMQRHKLDESRSVHKEEQHDRKERVELLFPGVPEQSTLIKTAQASALSFPLHQDETTVFAAGIEKTKTNLIRATKDYKTHATAEKRERLESAIAECEESVRKLKVTSEIDDDKRKTLERQINAALKSARKARDNT